MHFISLMRSDAQLLPLSSINKQLKYRDSSNAVNSDLFPSRIAANTDDVGDIRAAAAEGIGIRSIQAFHLSRSNSSRVFIA